MVGENMALLHFHMPTISHQHRDYARRGLAWKHLQWSPVLIVSVGEESRLVSVSVTTVWGTRHVGKQGTTSGTGTITFSLSKLKPPFHLGSSDVLMIAAKFGANSVQIVN